MISMKTIDDLWYELIEHYENLANTLVGAVGIECEKELMRLKGEREGIYYVLELLRPIRKHHDCNDYKMVKGEGFLCLVCGNVEFE